MKVLLLLISGSIAVFVWFFVDWLFFANFNLPSIKFQSFKKFYEINPHRWMLKDYSVLCKVETFDYEQFGFNFLDWRRYKRWYKQFQRNTEQEKNNASIKRMMDAVKQDIANSEAEAKKMQYKAFDDLIKWAKENTNKDVLDLQKLVEEYKKIYENIQ